MTELQFANLSDARIAYHDIGQGKPILLIHGFASNARVNWINTNWVKALNAKGHRCIALDNRGHGESQKFYAAEDYGPDILDRDAVQLMDYLNIERFSVIGYSMGARISAWMAMHYPDRLNAAVFGGMGERMVAPSRQYDAIIHALETEEPDTITDKGGQTFRRFADATGSDRMALAACIRPSRHKITAEAVEEIEVPILVAVGSEDDVGGSAQALADLIPKAQAVELPGLDHMKATGAQSFKDATLDFLERVS